MPSPSSAHDSGEARLRSTKPTSLPGNAIFQWLDQAEGGLRGMLYVRVYSSQQEQATPLRRSLMLLERAARPLLSRLPTPLQTMCLLPIVPLYILYQNLSRARWLGREYAATYGWNEALHAARDRWTPLFAHRHTYEEVLAWFRSENYDGMETLREEAAPEGVPA